MPITVVLDLRFKPEAVEEAVGVMQRVLAETIAYDGCLGVEPLRDRDDPAHLVTVERWASPEQDAAYREWRAGDGAIPDLPPLLAGMPSLTYFDSL